MAKIVINIIFTLGFILSTSGLTLQQNYCYDKLVSVNIAKTPDNCCDNPCSGCHIEVIAFKVTDSFIKSAKEIKDKEKPTSIKSFDLFSTNAHFNLNISRNYLHDYISSIPKHTLSPRRAQLQVYLC
jgi:hypothetical protein